MEENRPKSSTADIISSAANVMSLGYLKNIRDINSYIAVANHDIAGKVNEQSKILKRNNDIQKEIASNSSILASNSSITASNTSSIAKSAKNINKTLKNIDQNQKAMLEMQAQGIEMQRRQLEYNYMQTVYSHNQTLIGEQQLNVQKLSLIEQEIQSKIAIKRETELQKQKELKSLIFTLQQDYNKIMNNNDELTKYGLFLFLQRNINESRFKPDELEEINDKQFAVKILDDIVNSYKFISANLNDRNKEILYKIKNYPAEVDILNKEIQIIEEKIKGTNNTIVKYNNLILNDNNSILKYKTSILKYNNDIDDHFNSIARNKQEKENLQNELKRLEGGKNNKLSYRAPIIFSKIGLLSFISCIICGLLNTADIKSLLLLTSLLFLIWIISWFIAFILAINVWLKSPIHKKKKLERKLFLKSIEKFDTNVSVKKQHIAGIEQQIVGIEQQIVEKEHKISEHKGILENLILDLNKVKIENKELTAERDLIIEKYPILTDYSTNLNASVN